MTDSSVWLCQVYFKCKSSKMICPHVGLFSSIGDSVYLMTMSEEFNFLLSLWQHCSLLSFYLLCMMYTV